MTTTLTPDDARLALPMGARLIHAGMPKTGTTALQRAAAAQRPRLLELGTRYPGSSRSVNQRQALYAFLDRPLSWGGRGDDVVPDRRRWSRLVDEVAADPVSRVWLSVETLSESPAAGLRGILDALGGEAHVVLTVRSLPAQLASAWQQYLKSGLTHDFESWLRLVLADTPRSSVTNSFRVRSDIAGLVRKWAGVVGEERITLLVLDPADRPLLPRTFESMLALPSGTLEPTADLTGVNRSFTYGEAELLRSINQRIHDRDVRWAHYERFVREGVVDRLLDLRVPDRQEQRILPPRWAVDRMTRLAEQQVEALRRTDVRVVGDLEGLAAPVDTVESVGAPAEVPLEAAVDAVLGVLSVGLGRGNDFGEASGTRLDDVTASTLARTLGRRVSRRVRAKALAGFRLGPRRG